MNARKERALRALMTCPTKRAAAEAAGISERTLRSYLADEAFRAAYREASRDAVDEAARKARSSLALALDTLASIAADGEASPSARISAARSLLDYGLRLVELNDVVYILREAEGE